MEHIIQQTVEALRLGKTILYPTDTIWGIGCDARNSAAVERLYAIKERDRSKSMLVLIRSEVRSRKSEANLQPPTSDLQPPTSDLQPPTSPRPTTYILPRTVWHDGMHLEVAPNLPADDGTLGIRVPDHPFCQEVIRRLGAPLVSTSANLSGHPSPLTYNDIEDALKQRVDFCVPPLPEFLSGETRGSRIVKIDPDGSETVIRP